MKTQTDVDVRRRRRRTAAIIAFGPTVLWAVGFPLWVGLSGCADPSATKGVLLPPERVAILVKEMKPGEVRYTTMEAFRCDKDTRRLTIYKDAPTFVAVQGTAVIAVQMDATGVHVDMSGIQDLLIPQPVNELSEFPVLSLNLTKLDGPPIPQPAKAPGTAQTK